LGTYSAILLTVRLFESRYKEDVTVKINHSGIKLLRSRTISMRHISYMMENKVGRLNW